MRCTQIGDKSGCSSSDRSIEEAKMAAGLTRERQRERYYAVRVVAGLLDKRPLCLFAMLICDVSELTRCL